MGRPLSCTTPFWLAATVLTATAATAAVPSPSQSTIPTHIVLVGTDAGGVADPLGAFSVTVRNAGGIPVLGSWVQLRLPRSSGLLLCAQQPPPAQFVGCDDPPAPYVFGTAGTGGVFQLALVGHADRTAPGAPPPSLDIFADGVLLGSVPVAAYDQDGGGLGPSDQSLWLSDYFSSQYFERSDFDGDGALGPGDLSLWLTAFFGDGSLVGCGGVACP